MNPIKQLLNRLNGLHYQREYCCLSKDDFPQPLHFYLVAGNRILADITNEHYFVGYSPLIFLLKNQPQLTAGQPIRILVTASSLPENENISSKDALAELYLEPIKEQPAGENQLWYYRGTKGRHHFLSFFQQLAGGLYNNWFNKQPGNIFLDNNLYRQVQIAYSLPRIISLITVGESGLFNLFPTDLHGQPAPGYYVISLRTGGKALEQVKRAGCLLLSEMNADKWEPVYRLGKNHMQALKPPAQFPFSDAHSPLFHLPIPDGALRIRELQLESTFEEGVHTLLLFSIQNEQSLPALPQTLAHIHNACASWRYKMGIAGNYLGL